MARGNHTGKGGFQKGVSGNPGGKPKEHKEFVAACREKSEEALRVLYDLMRTSTKAEIRVDCAKYIIERAWGKVAEAKEEPSPEDKIKQIAFETVAANAESSNSQSS